MNVSYYKCIVKSSMFVGKDVAMVLLYNNLFVFLFIVYSIIYSTYDNTFRHYWHIQSIPTEYKSLEAITVVVLFTIYIYTESLSTTTRF